MPLLAFEGLRNRKTKQTKGTTGNAPDSFKIPDYDLVTPYIPKPKGQGQQDTLMVCDRAGDRYYIPEHNVVPVRLVWKKKGSEEQRKKELRAQLNAHGIEITEDDSESEDESLWRLV